LNRKSRETDQPFESIIGNSAAIQYVLFKVEQVAATDTAVLVLGETGTGKELVVRAIHNNSLRNQHPLVKVNCAALPSNLIESELFGHEAGAFTGAQNRQIGRFEVADGATIFLDEIGELPMELQTKLLRVLQEGEFERLGSTRTLRVDARVIAATNRNLEAEVRRGQFRQDLFYRLNVFPITVPPLRERIEDIPLLVEFFVDKASKRLGKGIRDISTSIFKTLQDHPWPGNVRELQNVIERSVIESSGPRLRLTEALKPPQNAPPAPLKTMETIERNHIVSVLEYTGWKVSGKGGATEILGLKRGTLIARMKKLGIQKP
jgi:chemotaxis protein methyltransferase CheR